MSNLTSVGITAGVPTSGTGTVSTIDQLLAAGVPISDGTTNLVAVKAASTSPVAGDKALVVSISPNSVNANGQNTMANSAPVTIASNQSAVPVTLTSTTVTGSVAVTNAIGDPALSKFATGKYITVAASTGPTTLQTSTGAIGDYISGILVIPTSTSPGAIVLTDNATAITVFAGGASSISNLVPFFIPLGAVSASGAWKITTLANASVIAIGKFS